MILRFGFISGVGWAMDFSLFALLGLIGTPLWLANFLSASIAVSFVFFASVRRVFRYNGEYILRSLVAYVIYQVVAIFIASVIIDIISSEFTIPSLISKLLVTPFTFYANFQFMSIITTGKFRLI